MSQKNRISKKEKQEQIEREKKKAKIHFRLVLIGMTVLMSVLAAIIAIKMNAFAEVFGSMIVVSIILLIPSSLLLLLDTKERYLPGSKSLRPSYFGYLFITFTIVSNVLFISFGI